MKRIILVLLGLVFVLGLTACKQEPSIVGRWAGNNAVFQFNKDGTVITNYNGQEENGTYTTDFAKNPQWIDFLSTVNGQKLRNEGLIRFINDNEIEITLPFASGDTRPTEYGKGSRVYTLDKLAQ